MKQHTKPCAECPFRRRAAAGWLGGFTPAEFKFMADNETRMPCHLRAQKRGVKDMYTNTSPDIPQCAGRAIYWANQCKLPRAHGTLLELSPDPETVFQWPHEFFAHHNAGVLKETR